jgi:hypothetical protein
MVACEVCGNVYDKPITVERDGTKHVFDCFACAIQLLAPRCTTCHTLIIGHGLEADGSFFCCAHCARGAGTHALTDRA